MLLVFGLVSLGPVTQSLGLGLGLEHPSLGLGLGLEHLSLDNKCVYNTLNAF